MTNDLLTFAFSSAQQLLVYMLLLSAQLALILALRTPVARYLGATTAYRLWALPLLWLPLYVIELPTPDWSWVQALLPEPAVKGVVSWFPLALQEFDIASSLASLDVLVRNPESASGLWRAAFSFWLFSTAALIALQSMRIHQFGKALARQTAQGELPHADQAQVPAGLEVCFVNGLTSPALFGIVQPRLLLPEDFVQRFDALTRPLIIKHEAVHYRRRDNLWNLVAMLLRTLFWFNPLLHMAWRRFRLDQELACDERVLQGTHPDEGKQYARTLLESMSGSMERRQPATITAWGNLRELRERTQMIKLHLKQQPRQRAGRWLLAVFIVGGGIATATINPDFSSVIAAEAPTRGSLGGEFREGIERVMVLRDQKDYAAASAILDLLEQGELNEREQYTLFLFRANLAQIQGQYEQAIVFYEQILSLNGSPLEVRQQTLQQLGALHYVLEQYETAIDYFERFIDISEDPQPNAVLRIAYAHYQLEQYESAILYAEQAIAFGEQNHKTYGLLRAAYLQLNDTEGGRRVNQKMLELFDVADDEALQAQFNEQEVRSDVADERPTQEYLPIVVIQPQYPNRALVEKVEGSVAISFTVNEQGAVVDPEVMEASPAGYFEDAALTAISRFKFNPRIGPDGLAVTTPDVRYVFRFNLTE